MICLCYVGPGSLKFLGPPLNEAMFYCKVLLILSAAAESVGDADDHVRSDHVLAVEFLALLHVVLDAAAPAVHQRVVAAGVEVAEPRGRQEGPNAGAMPVARMSSIARRGSPWLAIQQDSG
jgi:hypothetical protein